MNKILSLLVLVILISLPVETSLSFAEEEEEPDFGEDIAIQVDQIMPRIVRTGLLEQRDVKVYGLLMGMLTTPTIKVPKIKNIQPRNYTVSTKPLGMKVNIGGISYAAPRVSGVVAGETTLSNLGAIVIPIKRIPKEKDVPDEIKIDIDARINLDVSEGVGYITTDDVLVEENEKEWRKEDHSFFGGYIRVNEIKDDTAGFMFYDNNELKINQNPIYIKVNEEREIRLPFGTYGVRSFKVKVNEIRSRGDSAKVSIYHDNEVELRNLRKGQELYKGSEWVVDEFRSDKEKGRDVAVLILRNSKRDREEIRLEEPKCIGYRSKESCLNNKCYWGEDNICRESEEKKIKGEVDCSLIKEEKKCTGDCEWDDRVESSKRCVLKGTKAYDAFIKKYGVNDYLKKDKIEELFDDIKEYPSTIQQKYKEFFSIRVIGDIGKIDETVLGVQGKLELIKFIREKVSEKGTYTFDEVRDVKDYYERAIQYFREVVNVYPGETELGSEEILKGDALIKIAELYEILNDETNAVQYYEEYKKEYPNEAKAKSIDKRIELLRLLQDGVAKQVTLEDYGKEIKIVLYGVTKYEIDESAKSLIEVYGENVYGGERWYKEGDFINGLDEEMWRIDRIRDGYVDIRDKNGNTKSLSLRSKYEIKKGVLIRVNKIDMKKEVHITLRPNVRNAYTDSYFSVHIPIEKRPFDLPLFSESIDEEIGKTRDLIKDLDKIIKNVENLHKFWIKFCFITFGTFWGWNLLTGAFGSSNEAIAKKRVKERWNKEYEKELEKNPGLSYDNFIIKNQGKYEEDLKKAEQFYKSPSYSVDDDSFKELDKKDLFERNFYERMCEGSNYYCDKFAEVDLKLRVKSIERQAIEISDEALQGEFSSYNLEDIKAYRSTFQRKFIDKKLKKEIVDKKGDLIEGYRGISNVEGITKAIDLINPYPLKGPDEKFVSFFNFEMGNGKVVYVEENEKLDVFSSQDNCKSGKNLQTVPAKDSKIWFQEKGRGCFEKTVVAQTVSGVVGEKIIAVNLQGRNKGTIQRISVGVKPDIDKNCYAQMERRSSGEVNSVDVYCYRGNYKNRYDDKMEGDLDTELSLARSKENSPLIDKAERKLWEKYRRELVNAKSAISKLDKKIGNAKQGEKVDGYTLINAPVKAGASCTDFMSVDQCKILFNACDPVICPASRCNLGGYWDVDNVIETGLIGSSVLCWHNSVFAGGNVVMPVCVTGILAGLKNIRTILQGYVECLQTSKTEGKSVGVCDRIRSFYFCEMLWREGMAIFNVKNGVLRWVVDKIFGKVEGGVEYSNFQEAVSSSIGALEYFTNDYAKGVFVAYQGRALEELGGEVCKLAVYGKAPGLGDFFDQVTRPESPPQFTAFFEEIPYQDIKGEESMYQVYYHVYAGENDDITYSVYLQKVDDLGEPLLGYPVQYVDYAGRRIVNQRLNKGEFADVNANFIGRSGYNQLCIIYNSRMYGIRRECGFGKVSTGYSIQLLGEYFAKQDAGTKISSREQCVPETGRLTSYSYKSGLEFEGDVSFRQSIVGGFSTGLASTGVVRKCSAYNPGVGGKTEDWVAVGVCGEDEEGRDLGVCWLYKPGLEELFKDNRSMQELLEGGLKNAEEEVRKLRPELFKDSPENQKAVEELIRSLKGLISGSLPDSKEDLDSFKSELKNKISLIQQYFDGRVTDTKVLANMNYYLGLGYEYLGKLEEKRCSRKHCDSKAEKVVVGEKDCKNYRIIETCEEKYYCEPLLGCMLRDLYGYEAEEAKLVEKPIPKPEEKKPAGEEPIGIPKEIPETIKGALDFYEKNTWINDYLNNPLINPNKEVTRGLLLAVIAQESKGNSNAVSPCASAGIMQFTPDTAIRNGLIVQFKGQEFTELNENIKTIVNGKLGFNYKDLMNNLNAWKDCSLSECDTNKCSPCNSYNYNEKYCDKFNDERFIPKKAIEAGINHLNKLMKENKGNVDEALKKYHNSKIDTKNEEYLKNVKNKLNQILNYKGNDFVNYPLGPS